MKPITPSIEFLIIMIVATFLFVVLSQRIKKYENTILGFVWVVYMCIILSMTLPSTTVENTDMTFMERLVFSPPWNIKPFALIPNQFKNMLAGQHGAMKQFLGNIILFIPAGFFPPMLFPKMRKWYGFIVPGFLWSFFIETMQLILNLSHLGNRSFDTDDLILNVCGAMIGYIIYKVCFAKSHKIKKKTKKQTK